MKYDSFELQEVCSFIDYRGKTPPKTASGIPLITAKIIKNGQILPPQKYIAESYYSEWMRRGIPKKGAIVLTTEAPLGEVAQIDTDKKLAFAQRVIILEPDERYLVPDYLLYALQDVTLKERIHAKATGTTVLGIKSAELKKVQIDLPSVVMQRKISSILKNIDRKIRCNQTVNDNLYDLVNTLCTKLFKDTDCEMTTVEDYVDCIYSGGTPATSNMAYWNGNLNWFSSGETRNRFVISTEKTITQLGADNSSTKSAQKYDIVIASAGQGFTRGQTSMLLLNTYINQSVIVLHAKKTVLPYLFWNLTNRYDDLRAISDSSSIRGSLTTKMLSKLKIPKVEDSLILKFSEFAWSIIPQIENNLIENKRLTDLRDSLLPKLMSGEIDVSDIQL